MKKANLFIAVLTFLIFLPACEEKLKPKTPEIMDEISGVWRANGDGTLVSIIYDDKKTRLLFGDDSIPVSLGEVDNTNKTVNMNVTLINGKPGVWTIRQVWDREKTSYYLQLTLHDGTQDKLSFVRKISTDDLNKIANAESRATSGSISESVKTAETITPAAPPIQVEPEIKAPAFSRSSSSVEAQTTPVTDSSSEINWMPSFDCSKASMGSERLICSNKELSGSDVKLAQVYKSALNRAKNKNLLKNSQKAWRLNERDACADVLCMLNAYQSRIAQLDH